MHITISLSAIALILFLISSQGVIQSLDTVCGYVRNIGRENETTGILTLKELADFKADMFTTIYIGNSHTKVINGKMVTPRGYKVV